MMPYSEQSLPRCRRSTQQSRLVAFATSIPNWDKKIEAMIPWPQKLIGNKDAVHIQNSDLMHNQNQSF